MIKQNGLDLCVGKKAKNSKKILRALVFDHTIFDHFSVFAIQCHSIEKVNF